MKLCALDDAGLRRVHQGGRLAHAMPHRCWLRQVVPATARIQKLLTFSAASRNKDYSLASAFSSAASRKLQLNTRQTSISGFGFS